MVNNQLCVDVIPDWKLAEAAPGYTLIVLPDWFDIGGETRDALLAYARDGDRQLIMSAENAALFEEARQVRLTGQPARTAAYIRGREVFAAGSGV